jgi:hypothetical protein
MKTLYALAFVCLSVPALAGELDFNGEPYAYPAETGYVYELAGDFSSEAESTASIALPATPRSEDVWAEIWLGPQSDPAADDLDSEAESTASIVVPAAPRSEDIWAEIWLGQESDQADQHDVVAANPILDGDWR